MPPTVPVAAGETTDGCAAEEARPRWALGAPPCQEFVELGVQLLSGSGHHHGALAPPRSIFAEGQVPVGEQLAQMRADVIRNPAAVVDEHIGVEVGDVPPAHPAQREQPTQLRRDQTGYRGSTRVRLGGSAPSAQPGQRGGPTTTQVRRLQPTQVSCRIRTRTVVMSWSQGLITRRRKALIMVGLPSPGGLRVAGRAAGGGTARPASG
ncbi:MAG: hypothetical protein ACT4NY_09790 [Pseudonocardiales bacterium]